MYVYCSYNELKSECLKFKFYYSNLKINISIMRCILVELKIWYLNLKNIYVN